MDELNGSYDASVIVPTKNRVEFLRKFLPTLAEQDTHARYEIIVVNNGSTDSTEGAVSEMSGRWPFIRGINEPEPGSARARHAGVAAAKAPIVIFVDDDMRAAPGFIQAHLKAHAETPRACILGNVITERGKHPFERMLGYIFDGARDSLKRGEPQPADYWSGNVSLPRELYVKQGGYDPVFADIGYGLDLDFGKRLLDSGVELLFEPDAITYHNFSERFADRLEKSYRAGIAYGYIRDHFPDMPVPDVNSSDSPLRSRMIERACKIAAALMEPLDRGPGVPMKPLAFVYDLAIQKALGRGLTDYSIGRRQIQTKSKTIDTDE